MLTPMLGGTVNLNGADSISAIYISMHRFYREDPTPCLISNTPKHPDVISHVVDAPPAAPARMTKAERLRAEAATAKQAVKAFAETKPSRKELREYFARMIHEMTSD
jgi:hypothetical protein